MSCITRHQASHQLMCNFPASVDIPAIAVYFTPDPGSERRVVNCVQLEDLECTYESGFNCEVLTSKYAEITVPESFQKISGTFRCQTPGFSTADIRSCHWPPAVKPIPDGISQTAATFSTSQYNENFTNQAGNEGSAAAVIFSVAFVLAIILLIVLVVGIMLRKNGIKDHKKRKEAERLNFDVKFSKNIKRPTSSLSSSPSPTSSTDSDDSEYITRLRDVRKKKKRSKGVLTGISRRKRHMIANNLLTRGPIPSTF